MCLTAVLAHILPLAGNVRHTTNTMNYTALLQVMANNRKKIERGERDLANWDHGGIRTLYETTAGLKATKVYMLLPRGTTGIKLCQMLEVEFFRRLAVKHNKAKDVYEGFWTLICNTKSCKRQPDSNIFTSEQEAMEINKAKRLQEEKVKLWAERKKLLRSEF